MTLDRDEMIRFVLDVFGTQTKISRVHDIFDEVDMDCNGVIDRDEMLVFVKRLRTQQEEEDHEETDEAQDLLDRQYNESFYA